MNNISTLRLDNLVVSTTESQVARRASFKSQKQQFADLVASIKAHGILQPIVVRPIANGKHEIVAGERRYLAADAAGLEEIPASVRDLDDESVIEIQLIENLQRADVHPMHEAEGYNELMQKHGLKVQELMDKVGKSRSYIFGRLKLLALSAPARKAFYDGRMSASIALLVARIPEASLQRDAIKTVADADRPIAFRRAKQIIEDEYMLRLADAPFDPNDADLVPKAGDCGACSFRTGNQPELFADIKGTDVCTSPKCFAGKIKAHGARLVAEARKQGRKVIDGAEAKKLYPHGNHYLQGYEEADNGAYQVPGNKKVRTVVGRDIEPTLIVQPETGRVIEAYPDSVVKAAIRKATKGKAGAGGSLSGSELERRKATKLEKAFRLELYKQSRPKLKKASAAAVARVMFNRLGSDAEKLLCKIRDFEPPKSKGKYYTTVKYEAIIDGLEDWSPAVVNQFINDCIYVTDLQVWQAGPTPESLLAAAKEAGVDAKAVRASVTPKPKAKKKAKKKAAKKAPARKKAAKKKAGRLVKPDLAKKRAARKKALKKAGKKTPAKKTAVKK